MTMQGHVILHKGLIGSFGWEQLYNPFFNLDFAASGFHLFQHLRAFFGGQWFYYEVKIAVMDWASLPAADIFDIGIQNLLERYDKCLNKIGNYVEK